MKILQINTCNYHRGGSETVYFNTSHILKDRGHKVALFSSKDDRNEPSEFEPFFIPHINIRELSAIGKIKKMPSYLYNEMASKNLELLLNAFKPDIAHVHLFYGVFSVSILKTLRKHEIPIVHTVHDYRLLCPVKNFTDRNGHICELCKDKHFFHCLQKKCSEGKFTQSAMVMLEAYFWKYFMTPINYIDHFIFVSNFSMNIHVEFNDNFRSKSSQLYNFSNNLIPKYIAVMGDYFLYFGRLSAEKGIKTMLTVFSERKDQKLVIAGTGPMKDYVENIAEACNNIKYVGFKLGKDLEFLIRNSSFVIVPSEWYENNPMVIIEAYTFGKPVIGADIGGIPELVKHRINGYLFESGSQRSLESAVDYASGIKKEEYENLSGLAYQFAQQNFNSENYYLKLNKIYTDLV